MQQALHAPPESKKASRQALRPGRFAAGERAFRFHVLERPNRVPLSVEFYGIVRAWAGVAAACVDADGPGGVLSVGDVLAELAAKFPPLAATCIDERRLRPGFALSVNGERLLTDPAALLRDGQTLLLFSIDAGG